MNPFKSGDRVQITATDYEQPHLAVGQTGVVAYTLGRNSLMVCMDSGPYRTPPTGDGWIFLVEEVRKLEGGAA